jgi:flagellar hook-length control protein FliK
MHMEVNHDKLASIAALGLIALRSSNSTASGSSFVDCLKPRCETASPPPSERSTPPYPAPKNEQPSSVQATDDRTAKDDDDESDDDKRDSSQPAAGPPAATSPPPPPTVPSAEAKAVATEKGGEALDTDAKTTEAIADTLQTPLVPVAEATVVAPQESPDGATAADTALPAATSPEGMESEPASTKAVAENAKRGKVRPQALSGESAESSSKSDDDKSLQPASKPPAPAAQWPDNTTIIGPPEVAPLDQSPADDGDRSTGAKEPLAVIADNKQLQPSVEPNAPTAAQAPDPSLSAAQPDTSAAVGTAATTPKPPAAFLKSKAAHANSDRPTGEIDPAKFLSRVAKAFESAHERGSEVRLRLHPAELGALSIEIKVRDSVLTASVQTETSDAKAAIVDNLPALRERLADQGIRIDQFDVDLMDHSDRRQQSLEEQARRQEDRQPNAPRGTSRRPVSSEPPPGRNLGQHRTNGQNGLNVVI